MSHDSSSPPLKPIADIQVSQMLAIGVQAAYLNSEQDYESEVSYHMVSGKRWQLGGGEGTWSSPSRNFTPDPLSLDIHALRTPESVEYEGRKGAGSSVSLVSCPVSFINQP